MSSPGENQTVHVFTDDQFKQLLETVTKKSTLEQVGQVAKTGAEDVLANIKQLLSDAEGTIGHVHGAAQQFHADVKANRWAILFSLATAANSAFILHQVFHGLF